MLAPGVHFHLFGGTFSPFLVEIERRGNAWTLRPQGVPVLVRIQSLLTAPDEFGAPHNSCCLRRCGALPLLPQPEKAGRDTSLRGQ
jgi:hypothetical protein